MKIEEAETGEAKIETIKKTTIEAVATTREREGQRGSDERRERL